MNILHTVQYYHPSVGGMQEVVMQISERLVKLGHRVTVATTRLPERKYLSLNGVDLVGFDISGNAVKGYQGDPSAYTDFLLNSDFDVITNFAAQQWASDLAFPILERIRARKVFVPTGFSALHLPEYRGYFQQMAGVLKKYDRSVYLSDTYQDIDFARRHGVGNTVLIPNGAGEAEFAPAGAIDIRAKLGIPRDHFLIIHVGSHTGVKGHAETIEIFKRARIRNATLLLIGNAVSPRCGFACRQRGALFNLGQKLKKEGKRLIVTSLTREETVGAYHQADLFLFPSNVECSPIVLFECMASRTPFLTTDVGNAAEIIAWSGAGVLLPTRKNDAGFSTALIDESARMLEHLHGDCAARTSMMESGANAWRERFTWEKIALQYQQLYQELTGSR